MNDDEGIDFHKLEKELASAVEADEKYQRENDAKFRAVEQRVGSYEEFRDIVSAAHLKPLERKDITGDQTVSQPWNPHARGNSHTRSAPALSSMTSVSFAGVPRTANEFSKVWKRKCETESEKYQLLIKIGGNKLQQIFRTEISMGFLGEFLTILHNCFDADDADDICNILEQLSRTNRFDLSLKFLDTKERTLATKLVKKLGETRLGKEPVKAKGEQGSVANLERCQQLSDIYSLSL